MKEQAHRPLSFLRWPVAFSAVLMGHAAVVLAAYEWQPRATASAAAPPAVLIDLAAAPEKPLPDMAPGPQSAPSEPQQKVEEKPVEEAKVESEIPPPPPKEAAVVLPEPKPKEAKQEKKKSKASVAMATPTSQPRVSDRVAAQAAGAASTHNAPPASWKNDLLAQLNRYKRYPPGASGTGIATIAFSIDRSGRVKSTRLVQSSGIRALDEEAMALPGRASPLPPIPAEIAGATVALSVPIRFAR